MGSSERRAREKEHTRQRILGAARDLFVREGVDAVSLRKIAEAIEYTAPAIYSHFPDKHALLVALCDQDFGSLRESMRHVEAIADPLERLHAMGRAYVEFALAHPHHYRFMFMIPVPADAPAPDDCRGHGNPDQDGYAFLERTVRDCIDSGRLRLECRDARVVTQAFWAAAHGVVSLYITHGNDPWVDFARPRESAYLLLDAAIRGMCLAQTTTPPGTPRPTLPPTARPRPKRARSGAPAHASRTASARPRKAAR